MVGPILAVGVVENDLPKNDADHRTCVETCAWTRVRIVSECETDMCVDMRKKI